MKNFFKVVALCMVGILCIAGCTNTIQEPPIDEPNIPSVIAENITDTAITTVAPAPLSTETTTEMEDPWLLMQERLQAGTVAQAETGATDVYAESVFTEVGRTCVMLKYHYYNMNNEYVGKGVYSVYIEPDDFEINFRVFVKNKIRFPSIVALHPMLPQDTDMYSLTFDAEDELPYEFGLKMYRWHLTSFPSADSIRNWGNTWISGGYCEPFFNLSSAAEVYFKSIGKDSQVIPATRYATYASKFSSEDPYFVDSVTGIKYMLGINEAVFSDTGNTVAIPYLRVCDITDLRDIYCSLYYKYGDAEKTFVPEEWIQDYPDISVSGVIEEEINPGESVFGYIVMPYYGDDIYRFYGVHGNMLKFKLYPQQSEISNMLVCVQESCIVNSSAVVDYDTLLGMADYYCDTSSTLLSQNVLYTEADKSAFTNYYNYVKTYTDENIWLQFACNPYLMWCIKDDVLHIYHIADDTGEPAYMLSGDIAWAVVHSVFLSNIDIIRRNGGISGYLDFYNNKFGSSVSLHAVR